MPDERDTRPVPLVAGLGNSHHIIKTSSQEPTLLQSGYDGMYYTHNIHFLASPCSMEGNKTCALDAAARLVVHVNPQVEGRSHHRHDCSRLSRPGENSSQA